MSTLRDRTGVAESRISEYEHGRHQPSFAMMQRLLSAAGHSLIAVRRVGIDPRRNARIFADVLSLADAIPRGTVPPNESRVRQAPPTWSELTELDNVAR